MPRVFIDTGILILASQAKEDEISQRAIAELDREVTFLSSKFVELEALPQTILNNYKEQENFLRIFFENAESIEYTQAVHELAFEQAHSGIGLDAVDAIHVASAMIGNATELVTREGVNKRLPKAVGITVRTIAI